MDSELGAGHCVLTDFGLSASLVKRDKVHSFSGTAIYLGAVVTERLVPQHAFLVL